MNDEFKDGQEPNTSMFAGRIRAEKSAGGRAAAPATNTMNGGGIRGFFQRVGNRVRNAAANLRNRFRP